MIQRNSGITLIALIITIIILLILAGVTISTLTESGLFNKAKLAEQKSENAQIKEETTLGDYGNKIEEYIGNTRDSDAVIKNLLDKEEVCDLSTGSWKTIDRTVTLNDSIKKYDELCFTISAYHSAGYYHGFGEYRVLVNNIKYYDTAPASGDRTIYIKDTMLFSASQVHNYVIGVYFKDDRNMYIESTGSSTSSYTKVRIDSIYGIKY